MFTRNRSTASSGKASHVYMLDGNKPGLRLLRVCGRFIYVLKLKKRLRKLEPKAQVGRLFG